MISCVSDLKHDWFTTNKALTDLFIVGFVEHYVSIKLRRVLMTPYKSICMPHIQTLIHSRHWDLHRACVFVMNTENHSPSQSVSETTDPQRARKILKNPASGEEEGWIDWSLLNQSWNISFLLSNSYWY